MGIKINNPKSSIIIEGLWGLGKTSVAKRYCEIFGYKLITEPIHTSSDAKCEEIKDIDFWYINQHVKRMSYLRDFEKMFLERSVFSSFAFLYSLKKQLPDAVLIDYLRRIIQKKNVLVVYLRAKNKKEQKDIAYFEKYSKEITGILSDLQMKSRYENWYENILPKKYGVTPFILDILDQNNAYRSTDKIVNEINLVLRCNRVAQINIVCFTRLSKASKDIKILVLKRNKKRGGFWQTITGGVHVGEGLRDTARRELFEEVGVFCDDAELFLTPLTYSFMGNDGYFLNEYVFGYEISDYKKVRISDEHDSMEWVDFNEAINRVAYENNKKAISVVVKKIDSQTA